MNIKNLFKRKKQEQPDDFGLAKIEATSQAIAEVMSVFHTAIDTIEEVNRDLVDTQSDIDRRATMEREEFEARQARFESSKNEIKTLVDRNEKTVGKFKDFVNN